MTDTPTLTFGEGAAEFVTETLGFGLTSEDYLVDPSTGRVAQSVTQQPVHIDEFAGVVKYDGEMTPVRDDFNELVELVKDKYSRKDSTDCPECGARMKNLYHPGRENPTEQVCPRCGERAAPEGGGGR